MTDADDMIANIAFTFDSDDEGGVSDDEDEYDAPGRDGHPAPLERFTPFRVTANRDITGVCKVVLTEIGLEFITAFFGGSCLRCDQSCANTRALPGTRLDIKPIGMSSDSRCGQIPP